MCLLSKLKMLVLYLQSQKCIDGVMISSLITGITLRDDTQNAARPDTLQ